MALVWELMRGEGSISTAYGSAMVKVGSTAVTAGVQAELAFEDLTIPSQLSTPRRSNEGWSSPIGLVINVEVGGIAGTNFNDKPEESTQALASRLRDLAVR